MKERKTFIDKVKEVYEQYTDATQIAMLVAIAIALFIAGYLVAWNFFEKPLNDNQFEACEQVARDIYAQKAVISEVAEDFSVSMTTTAITVRPTRSPYRGKVIARVQNDELVIIRDMETGGAIFFSILIGIFFVLVPILLLEVGVSIYQKLDNYIYKRRDK